jgi:hypothetical protein
MDKFETLINLDFARTSIFELELDALSVDHGVAVGRNGEFDDRRRRIERLDRIDLFEKLAINAFK